MCEMLIRAKDNTHPDAIIDLRQIKRGHVVAIVEDDWKWGTAELDEKMFYVLKLPKVPVEKVMKYLEQVLNPNDLISSDPLVSNNPRTIRFRRYKFDLDNISSVDVSSEAMTDDQKISAIDTVVYDQIVVAEFR